MVLKKEENLHYFIRFCNYVFENLHNQVTLWSIYNEPVAYVVEAYYTGKKPPYEKGFWNLAQKAGNILKNLLEIHVTLYQEFKAINPKAQIGLIKMFMFLDPYNNNFIEKFICNAGNNLTNNVVLNFFKTGTFSWFNGIISYSNQIAPQCLDFIGINYYRHELIECNYLYNFKRKLARKDELIIPESNKAVYPEGLYRSIILANELNLPIYITENGIATHNEILRNDFIKKHLYVVQKAINNGYNVRGYHYWTLFDTTPYGLYAVDLKTKKRTLRDGAKPFVKFLKEHYLH